MDYSKVLTYDEITNMPVLVNLNPWIKSSDRLPDKDGYYYVFTDKKIVCIAFLDNDQMCWLLDNPYRLTKRRYDYHSDISMIRNVIDSVSFFDKHSTHMITHWKHLSLPPEDFE